MKTNEKPKLLAALSFLTLAVAIVPGCARRDDTPAKTTVGIETGKDADDATPSSTAGGYDAKETYRPTDTATAEDVRERELRLRERELDQRERELARKPATPAAPPADDYDTHGSRGSTVVETPAAREVDAQFVTLPAATALDVEFLDELSSETSAVGDRFTTRVVHDVVKDGYLVIPAGAEIEGQVSEVVPSKKVGGQAKLGLVFDRLDLPHGDDMTIAATLSEVGRGQTKKDAATIGGSAAGGALLGRILSKDDKTKGTLIGAVVGGAIGAAVASKNASDPVVLPQGTLSQLTLDEPLRVALRPGAGAYAGR